MTRKSGPTKHICPYCKERFAGRANRIFCSRSHSEMYHRSEGREPRKIIHPNMTGRCLHCGADVPMGQRYCCDLCGKNYRYKTKYSANGYEQKHREKPSECTCGDYQNCIRCRNAERRRAFKANEPPKYLKAWYANITMNGIAA